MGAKLTKPAGPTVVKKVSAYPITGLVAVPAAPQPVRVKILKVTTIGMIVDPVTYFFHVGECHQIEFDLPVIGATVKTEVKIIKTHDRFDATSEKKLKLVEMHFKDIAREPKNAIAQFLGAVGQTEPR
jgi:hypothetical protein